MDSSTSRVLLAVLICVGILFAWNAFVARKGPRPEPRPAGERQSATDAEATGEAESAEAAAGTDDATALEPTSGRRAKTAEGEHATLQWPAGEARLTFTDRGAALRRAILLNPRFKEMRRGKLQQVDLVQTRSEDGLWPLVTTFPRSEFQLPADAQFELVRRGERSARYVWRSAKVRVSKHYVLDEKRPVMWFTLEVANLTDESLRQRLQVELFSRQGEKEEEAGITNPYPRRPTALCHVNGELERRSASSIRGQDSGCGPGGCGVGSGELSQVGRVRWIGTDDRYFMTALVPRDEEIGQLRCAIKAWEGDAKLARVSLDFPEGSIKPDEVMRRRFVIYLGAKDLEQLDTVKGPAGEEAKLGEAIEFGWFDFLSRPMLGLMKVFERVTGNWGLAIILLTVLVKLITLYWSTKSMRSMRQMQRLKPKIDELRERFKDDKQRLNQEMMALYKVHRVSPLGGCLPMLIQMPIWFALYSTLGNAQELYRSGFLGWINDLTSSDPYYILPVAVGAAMFAQQAISPQPMEGAQAKMMKYGMPLMFSVFMMWLPAGLTLYILVNTVLTMFHQWYINRTDPMPAGGDGNGSAGRGTGPGGRGPAAAQVEGKPAGVGSRRGGAARGTAGRSAAKRRRKKSR